MSVKHSNISIFVPHLGCPNQCTFCNQRHIACVSVVPTEDTVHSAVKTAKESRNYNSKTTEIAFFGGSFTAIDREYMCELLSAAKVYVDDGTVSGIRISTRPDAIDKEILETLKKYGVTAIELGAQSMSDSVLKLNKRGHTVKDVCVSADLIKQYGFSLGLQMMTGLYGSNDNLDLLSAEKIIELKPDTVRIYPTIVLQDTDLEELYKNGEYAPQTLDAAVDSVSKILLKFKQENINVIRTGLHTIDMGKFVAGPWHPSFKELCDARIFLNTALGLLKNTGEYEIYVNDKSLSKMIGQKRENIQKLENLGYKCKVFTDKSLGEYDLIIKGK